MKKSELKSIIKSVINEVRLKSDKGMTIDIKDIDFTDEDSIDNIFTEPATDDDIEEFENAWNVTPIWGSKNGYLQVVKLPTGEYLFADTSTDHYAKTQYGITVINEVRFTSSKIDKLKAFKDRDGGVSIYYNEPGADWFSQDIESNYGRINPRTGLVDFYFWSDEKMSEFEDILDYNNIKYNKDSSDEDNDLISIEQNRFDFIEKALGPDLKDIEDNEWYNDRIK